MRPEKKTMLEDPKAWKQAGVEINDHPSFNVQYTYNKAGGNTVMIRPFVYNTFCYSETYFV